MLLFVTACGGGGGGGNSPAAAQTSATFAGIYSGTLTPNGATAGPAVGLITSDKNVVVIDTSSLEAFIGTISGTSLTGILYSFSAMPASAQLNTAVGDNIGGSYSSSIGGGQFSLDADRDLYNRPSSLAKLEGVWVDTVLTNITGVSTWVIQANGSFMVSSTGGIPLDYRCV